MESRENKNDEDKTEEASEEKRNQFREEGNIANPREIVGSAVLMFFTIYFYLNSDDVLKNFSSTFERAWRGFRPQEVGEHTIIPIILYTIKPIVNNIVTIFFVCIIFPLLVGLVLTKFNFAISKVNFNVNKMNFFSGVKRIFGFNSLYEFLKVFTKFSVFSAIIYSVIKSKIIQSQEMYFLNYVLYLNEIGSSIFTLLLSMSGAVFVLGIGDYALNLFKIERELKMSKKEVKDDIKKHEGDPQMKSRRKRMARDLILRKSLKDVSKATFIVTNPEHFAVAIRYLKGMNAPIVLAKGQDFMALKIREIAKSKNIMIVENKPLARTLYKTVKVGQEIPPSLYQAIIEIMKYIYKIRGKNYFDQFASNMLNT